MKNSQYVAETKGGWKKRSAFTVEEKGNQYKLKLIPAMNCASYQVDGYVIDSLASYKCDKLIVVDSDRFSAELFIELKGVDVNHAVDQLEATLKDELFRNTAHSVRWARIVSKSFPSNAGRSKIEKAKHRFMKLYDCELRPVKSGNPESLNKD